MAEAAEAVDSAAEAIETTEEQEENEESELEQEPKKRRIPIPIPAGIPTKFLIIGIAVLVLGGGGFLFRKPLAGVAGPLVGKAKSILPFGGDGKKAKGKKKAKKEPKKPVEPGPRVDVGEEFVLNLRDGGYIRMMLTLELNAEEAKEHGGGEREGLGEDTAPIRDAIITVLTTKTRDELSTPEGKESLKKEIRAKVNAALHARLVDRVYLTYFAIQ